MAANSDEAAYWLVAIPGWASSGDLTRQPKNTSTTASADDVSLNRRALEMKTTKMSDNFDFEIPKLRVGTLDTLMNLSDELGKLDTLSESLFKRIARTYKDLEKKDEKKELAVDQMSIHEYAERFRWNQAKYPLQAPLKDLVSKIQQDINAVDEELRKRTTKYQEVVSSLAAIERKETGTLLVKPLGGIVRPDDIIEKEYITTLLVVVPKAKEKQFNETYETMEELASEFEKKQADDDRKRTEDRGHHAHATAAAAQSIQQQQKDLSPEEKERLEMEAQELKRQKKAEERRKAIKNVVPQSAKYIAADGDFALYRILVLRKGADTIRNLCRENRYTVRSYEYDPEQMQNEKDEKAKLTTQKSKLLSTLLMWSEATFSDVFSAWIHLKAIRTFVESVLRFGIPVNFQAFLMKPKKGVRPKLRRALNELYGNLSGASLTGAVDSGDSADISGVGAEFYPYVYFPLNLDDS